MFAFKAAKRTPVLMLFGLLLAVASPAAAAGDHGYLGVMLQDVTTSMAKALQLDDGAGVLVNDVVEDSPAEKAGLADGDVILSFGGKTVDDSSSLTDAVREGKPGDEVEVVVLRDGKRKTLKVELGEREDVFALRGDAPVMAGKLMEKMRRIPGHEDMRWFGDGDHKVMVMPRGDHKRIWIGEDGDVVDLAFGGDRGFLGVHLDDIEGQLGEFFGVEDGRGALVTEVEEDSPAAAAGLKAGDVIVKIDDEEVDSTDALYKAMAGTEPEQKIKVSVVRKGDDKTFDVTLGELPEDAFAGNFRFFGDADGNARAPHVWHFDGDDNDVEVFEDEHPRVKIRREFRHSDDMDELRQELDELRQELKEMRQELKK